MNVIYYWLNNMPVNCSHSLMVILIFNNKICFSCRRNFGGKIITAKLVDREGCSSYVGEREQKCNMSSALRYRENRQIDWWFWKRDRRFKVWWEQWGAKEVKEINKGRWSCVRPLVYWHLSWRSFPTGKLCI